MCGIAGVLHFDPERPVDLGSLQAMGDAIAHRGPDGQGRYADAGVGLIHRRLSIIDLEGGRQPLSNEDGSIQVVFNGEIYNYRELQRELESRGHQFRTNSDTEVLVHLYEEAGPELVHRLRGMFAFAIWDSGQRRLLLARDRLGIKPLYVYRDEQTLLFGSEPKALLAHRPAIATDVDPEALEDYLTYGMVPGPRSIFRGVRKLLPAHVLIADQRPWRAVERRYWRLAFEPDDSLSFDQWSEAIVAKTQEAVQAHLVADVPVGAFLSGGVDSGVIVTLASEAGSDPLRTFSIGFREQAFNELPHARDLARHCGTRHQEEILTADAVALLDQLTHYFDEPFADSSAIPTFLVSELASRSVKVVLSGDGGDEAFGGYSRYAHDLDEASLRDELPPWFRRSALAPIARVWPKADWLPRPLRAKTRLTNLALNAQDAYANTLALCRPPFRRRLMAPDVATRLNGHDPARLVSDAYGAAPSGDPLAGMIAADVATLLPDDFLVKVDRASMANGLEVRPPLLDHELMELAARVPSRWKVRDGQTKWIFKRSFADRLPPGATTRAKQGFEIPIDAWLRGPLRTLFEADVLDRSARVGSLIDVSLAGRLFRDHLAGRGRHGAVLWSLLVLARWSERYLSHAGRPAPTGAVLS